MPTEKGNYFKSLKAKELHNPTMESVLEYMKEELDLRIYICQYQRQLAFHFLLVIIYCKEEKFNSVAVL
jgi:hypothetical protein